MPSRESKTVRPLSRCSANVTVFVIAYSAVVGLIIELFGGLFILSIVGNGAWATSNLVLFLFVHIPVGGLLTVLTQKHLDKWSLAAATCVMLISIAIIQTSIPFFDEPDPLVRLVFRTGEIESFQADFGSGLMFLLGISTGRYLITRALKFRRKSV